MPYIKSHYKEILDAKNGGNAYATQIFEAMFHRASQEDIDKMVEKFISGNYNAGIAMPAQKVVMEQPAPKPTIKTAYVQPQPKKEEYYPKPQNIGDISSLKDMKGHVFHDDDYENGNYEGGSGSYDMSEYDAFYYAPIGKEDDEE